MSVPLLDVDGTLLDSFPGIRAGFLHALGMSDGQVRRGLEVSLDCTDRGGWADATAYPGRAELLARWKGQGYTLYTATSKGGILRPAHPGTRDHRPCPGGHRAGWPGVRYPHGR